MFETSSLICDYRVSCDYIQHLKSPQSPYPCPCPLQANITRIIANHSIDALPYLIVR